MNKDNMSNRDDVLNSIYGSLEASASVILLSSVIISYKISSDFRGTKSALISASVTSSLFSIYFVLSVFRNIFEIFFNAVSTTLDFLTAVPGFGTLVLFFLKLPLLAVRNWFYVLEGNLHLTAFSIFLTPSLKSNPGKDIIPMKLINGNYVRNLDKIKVSEPECNYSFPKPDGTPGLIFDPQNRLYGENICGKFRSLFETLALPRLESDESTGYLRSAFNYLFNFFTDGANLLSWLTGVCFFSQLSDIVCLFTGVSFADQIYRETIDYALSGFSIPKASKNSDSSKIIQNSGICTPELYTKFIRNIYDPSNQYEKILSDSCKIKKLSELTPEELKFRYDISGGIDGDIASLLNKYNPPDLPACIMNLRNQIEESIFGTKNYYDNINGLEGLGYDYESVEQYWRIYNSVTNQKLDVELIKLSLGLEAKVSTNFGQDFYPSRVSVQDRIINRTAVIEYLDCKQDFTNECCTVGKGLALRDNVKYAQTETGRSYLYYDKRG